MEGSKVSEMGQAGDQPRSRWWHEPALLLLLLAWAGGMRAWSLSHTEVLARDGVGFIRYAWQLQEWRAWPAVMRGNLHPPFYPLTVLAMSYPVRQIVNGSDSAIMQLSAQLVSALAGLLLVVPMFYLGKDLFDRRVGFWAAVLFQCLPASSRVLSDVLSEGVFLFLIALALLLAVRACRHGSSMLFGLCGLCGGLAYLTRPEGVMVVAATGVVLLGMQAVFVWRRPWRQVLAGGASLTLGAVLIAGPYMGVIHHFTNKTTGRNILTTAFLETRGPEVRGNQEPSPASPLLASVVAAWRYGPENDRAHRLVWGLGALASELIKGYHYVAWLPALLALFWFRDRIRQAPGGAVVLILTLLHVLVLWRVAFQMGYVSERHSLLVVMCTLPWAIAGMFAISQWLANHGHVIAGPDRMVLTSSRAWSAVLMGGLVVSGLPKSLEPLHLNRAGHHAAGLWLAAHAQPGDVIVDPFDWAEFYAGQVFREGFPSCFTDEYYNDLPRRAESPTAGSDGHQPQHYVILGGTEHEHVRLPLIPIAEVLAKHGTLVYHWPEQKPRFKAEEVNVYAVRLGLDNSRH